MEERYRLNPVQKEQLLNHLDNYRTGLFCLLTASGIALAVLMPITVLEFLSKGFFGGLFGFAFPLMLLAGGIFIALLCKGYFSHQLGPLSDRRAVLKDECEVISAEIARGEANRFGAPPYILLDRAGRRYKCLDRDTYTGKLNGGSVYAVICPSGARYAMPKTGGALGTAIALNPCNTMVPPEAEGGRSEQ